MAEWTRAAQARNAFADMIESLTPEQMRQTTLCEAWDAHGVLAHLVTFAEITLPNLFGNLVKAGFDFDKAAVAMAAKRQERSVEDLVASLRANAAKSAPMPGFPEELTLGDAMIHTQDVRRPLGLGHEFSDEQLRTTLDFLTTHKHSKTLVGKPKADDVRLVATDMDWAHGDGAEITGTAEALMMGLAKRPVLDELAGEGVARWR